MYLLWCSVVQWIELGMEGITQVRVWTICITRANMGKLLTKVTSNRQVRVYYLWLICQICQKGKNDWQINVARNKKSLEQ